MFVAQEQVNWATVKADRQVPHPERQPRSCSPRSGTPRRLSLNEGRLPVPDGRMTCQGTSAVSRLRLRTDTKILRHSEPVCGPGPPGPESLDGAVGPVKVSAPRAMPSTNGRGH